MKDKILFLGCTGIYRWHVKELNRITDDTGAKIVLSSAWRLDIGGTHMPTAQHLWDWFKEQGVTGEFIGYTDRHPKRIRGFEIQKWLHMTELDVGNFIILDDDSNMEHLTPYLVNCPLGPTSDIADEAIRRLTHPL